MAVERSTMEAIAGVTGTGSQIMSTSPTLTTPTLQSPAVTGLSTTGILVAKTITFTEDATSVTHTGTVAIPAGAFLHEITITSTALWTDAQATIIVGDANDADGWIASTDLAATDLLVGERISVSPGTAMWGGKNGAYLTTAGRFGRQSTTAMGGYYPTASSVIGVVAVTTPTGTAGRTFMTVIYSVGNVTAATLA